MMMANIRYKVKKVSLNLEDTIDHFGDLMCLKDLKGKKPEIFLSI